MPRKIKIVKQFSEKDCGPACLLSIIRYYGGFIPLEKIKSDCNTDITGTTAYDLINASKKYGFDSTGYHISKEKIFDHEIIFPVICHVRTNNLLHYVVLYQISSRQVIIMDPAFGRKVLKLNDFFSIWTGNILEFYPKRKLTILKNDNKIADLFINIFSLESSLFIRLFINSVLLVVFTILCSYYFKVLIDYLDKDINIIKFICIFFIMITIVKCILHTIKMNYISYFNKNLNVYLYMDFIEHIFRLPSKTVQSKTMGEIITRINDLASVKSLFSEIFISFCLDLILTLIAIPILLIINYKLFIILLIIIILYFFIGIIFSIVISKKITINKDLESKFNTTLYENIVMNNNIKNLNKTNKVLIKLEKITSKYIYDSYKIDKINNYQNNIKYFIDEIGLYSIYTFGIYNIINSSMSISDLVFYVTLMNFFLGPIKNFTNNIPKYNFIKASIHKLNEFMNIPEEEINEKNKINNWSITISDLSFGYNDFKKILSNINIKIDYKDHLLISGGSGKGKSTLCKLLIKDDTATTGEIYYGDINIKDISLDTIRNNVVYISQKEYLYSDTIKNNILFYRDIDIEKFEFICKICKVDQILINKALRYDSFIEMDSSNLSGGEKQRIILARACLNKFNILIIDEALSEVDLETEKEIILSLREYFSDKTIIYISHKKIKSLFKKVIKLG